MFSTAGLDQVKIPGLILPVALSLAAIGLTTLVIIEAQSNSTALRDWRDPEHLTLAYLLPPIFVAVVFGSTAAVMTSFAAHSPLPTLSTRRNLAFCFMSLGTLRS